MKEITIAFTRRDLGDFEPAITGLIKFGISFTWCLQCFECEQPAALDNQEFNLILKSPVFEHGVAFARSSDFDFCTLTALRT